MTKEKKESKVKIYLKELFKFYFTPTWRSFLTILYLVIFIYCLEFYIGNLWLFVKFTFYTLADSASLASLSSLFWGIVFDVCLIIPFSISFYSIFLLFEVWRTEMTKTQKTFLIILIIIIVPLVFIIMDNVVRGVVSQSELQDFATRNRLVTEY